MTKLIFSSLLVTVIIAGCQSRNEVGSTEIARWQNNKKGAVSITYDDGNRNQFKVALPIMEQLGIPATFYIITGSITGSNYPGKFIGRPVKEIIAESAHEPTNAQNFFERASAAKYLGYQGAFAYYDKSAGLFESGRLNKAYAVMDSLYRDVRNGVLKPGQEYSMEMSDEKGLSWDSIKAYASKGYEFSSHTVTHTHLAVLDTPNIAYELGKSKEDIRDHLGPQYTFDAEIPFGIEHPRAMKYALPYYAALRNLMTDPWLKEINRGHKEHPGNYPEHAYVQWQRGPLSKTPYNLMTSWIDTTLAHNNIWLVLVFHGIDSLGWEPLSHQELTQYFRFIKDREDSLWVAPFGTVARYMRERMGSRVTSTMENDSIKIGLSDSLDEQTYNVPLTLKTYVPNDWQKIQVTQGDNNIEASHPAKDEKGLYILYPALPGGGPIVLHKSS